MNSSETISDSAEENISQSNGTVDYPPFQNPEAVSDYDTVRARELGEVIKSPDVVGLNLDSSSIVNPRNLRGMAFVEESLADGKTMEEISEQISSRYGKTITPEQIQSAINSEKEKIAIFDKEIDSLPDGTRFRVHSSGSQSPFVVSECIRADETGKKQVVFNEIAMKQIERLKEKAGDSGLTVVMNMFAKESGANTPKTPEEIESYLLMCREFIKQTSFENGKGLTLELGNETNVNRNTSDNGYRPFDKEEFGDSSSPEEYADFYYQVANRLKSEFPELKLSLAGTAFYDKTYVEKVVSSVQDREKGLIDVISFHPYRGDVEEGTAEIVDNKRQKSNLSFDEQFAEMKKIADVIGAKVTVGEVSFTKEWGKSINTIEQAKNTRKSYELGTISYIWPGCQILKYP
ncbi:hypothetical protein IKD67_01115 [Candidatus Saccharibacteria bacterium]|nr:hypothetical protein [Candidatus Saccharibacteria bacterium]